MGDVSKSKFKVVDQLIHRKGAGKHLKELPPIQCVWSSQGTGMEDSMTPEEKKSQGVKDLKSAM